MSEFPSANPVLALVQTRLNQLVAFWDALTRPASADFSREDDYTFSRDKRDEHTPSHKDETRDFAESFRFMHF